MAKLMDRCDRCDTYGDITYLHTHGQRPLCGPCLTQLGTPPPDTNAGRLDAFYIFALGGIDFETGEIVDPVAEAREFREFLIYKGF